MACCSMLIATLSIPTPFLFGILCGTMASLCRGQPLARQTKVVHRGPGCLKAGSNGRFGLDGSNDGMASKPSLGRVMPEDLQSGKVTTCGSRRCLTCVHMVVGETFMNNVNGRIYHIKCNSSILDCSSSNVIYLISCAKCGVQYIGKTSQTLRSRLNNHRNRLKQLCDLYLYVHASVRGTHSTMYSSTPLHCCITFFP